MKYILLAFLGTAQSISLPSLQKEQNLSEESCTPQLQYGCGVNLGSGAPPVNIYGQGPGFSPSNRFTQNQFGPPQEFQNQGPPSCGFQGPPPYGFQNQNLPPWGFQNQGPPPQGFQNQCAPPPFTCAPSCGFPQPRQFQGPPPPPQIQPCQQPFSSGFQNQGPPQFGFQNQASLGGLQFPQSQNWGCAPSQQFPNPFGSPNSNNFCQQPPPPPPQNPCFGAQSDNFGPQNQDQNFGQQPPSVCQGS